MRFLPLLMLFALPAHADFPVDYPPDDDFHIRVFRSGAGFMQTADYVDVAPDGSLRGGGKLSKEGRKKIRKMVSKMLALGVLKEGKPSYDPAGGSCVNPGSVVRVMYKLDGKTYTAGYAWSLLTSLKHETTASKTRRVFVLGLARLIDKSAVR